MKKTILIISSIIVFILIVYLAISNYTQVFWRTYSDDNISFRYPSQFTIVKNYKGTMVFSTKPDKRGLNDSIDYKFIPNKFDRTSIWTTGGTLPQEDLLTKNIGGKNFLLYSDGDAAYYGYTFIYELPNNSYYELGFGTNNFSKWNIDRDSIRILKNMQFRHD